MVVFEPGRQLPSMKGRRLPDSVDQKHFLLVIGDQPHCALLLRTPPTQLVVLVQLTSLLKQRGPRPMWHGPVSTNIENLPCQFMLLRHFRRAAFWWVTRPLGSRIIFDATQVEETGLRFRGGTVTFYHQRILRLLSLSSSRVGFSLGNQFSRGSKSLLHKMANLAHAS